MNRMENARQLLTSYPILLKQLEVNSEGGCPPPHYMVILSSEIFISCITLEDVAKAILTTTRIPGWAVDRVIDLDSGNILPLSLSLMIKTGKETGVSKVCL